MDISQFVKDSNYDVSLFTQAELETLGANITPKENNGKTIYNVRCLIRDTDIRTLPVF